MPRTCMILYIVNTDMGASTLEPSYVQIRAIHRHSTFCFACLPKFVYLHAAVNLPAVDHFAQACCSRLRTLSCMDHNLHQSPSVSQLDLQLWVSHLLSKSTQSIHFTQGLQALSLWSLVNSSTAFFTAQACSAATSVVYRCNFSISKIVFIIMVNQVPSSGLQVSVSGIVESLHFAQSIIFAILAPLPWYTQLYLRLCSPTGSKLSVGMKLEETTYNTQLKLIYQLFTIVPLQLLKSGTRDQTARNNLNLRPSESLKWTSSPVCHIRKPKNMAFEDPVEINEI